MSDSTVAPEALERLEEAATRYNTQSTCLELACTHLSSFHALANPATILTLLRSYRTLESENRIAMRGLTVAMLALEDAAHFGGAVSDTMASEMVERWLADARAQEVK